jgi:drug/metabolite transporter (DMT)-like permease
VDDAHLGALAALGTAGCWTVSAIAFSGASERAGSLAVNFARLVMAVLVLGLVGLVTRGLPLPTDAPHDALVWLPISGLVGFTLGDLCLFRAFVLLGARLSTLTMCLAPPVAAVVGFFALDERIAPLGLAGMALTGAGVAWAVLARERLPQERAEDARARRTGLWLALGGAVGQGVGLVLSKVGLGDYDPFAATQLRAIAGVAGFAAIYTVVRAWPLVARGLRDAPAMRASALGAVFGPVVGVSLSLLAVQHTSTGVASSLMALTPILVLPYARLVKKERIGAGGVLGAVLAVAGVALLFA